MPATRVPMMLSSSPGSSAAHRFSSILVSRVSAHRQVKSIRTFQSSRNLCVTPSMSVGKQNSRPGWSGRHGDDHVLYRDGLDAQSEPSLQSRKDKQDAASNPDSKEGGQGVHEKDDGNHNKRTKEEHPEAPEPVIGMNSERGSKGH